MTTWGVVSTIKAPRRETLAFCAYHLQAGAHRVFVYLDDPEDAVFDTLKAHPKIRPTRCDDRYWKQRGNRPKKHQVRQTANATHTYRNRADTDWLAHIDVDEFLVSAEPITAILDGLPDDVFCARVHPMEALAGCKGLYKKLVREPGRARTVARLYPTYGPLLKVGFLSHVAGKLFVRTGRDGLEMRIHNVFDQGAQNPGEIELRNIDLAHHHATNWEHWLRSYRYRLEKGSYRADLAPQHPRERGGQTLHEVLSEIEARDGETGLRAFFEELCVASPDLIARLERGNLLGRADLKLEEALQAQFPGEV